MYSQLYSTFSRHKRTLAALLFGVAFSAVVAYATPPTSPYTAGETLDPSCAPGDTNCSVLIIPDQTGNAGEYLTTNGTTLSWAAAGGSSLIGSTSTLGTETWLGTSVASMASASMNYTVFIGIDAGSGATGAQFSNFIGSGTGYQAVNAQSSNFIGNSAGAFATNALASNFIGANAGLNATNAYRSTFIGDSSGDGAAYATRSIFIGNEAGQNAGDDAQYDAEVNLDGVYFDSIFMGYQAGKDATFAQNSNFIGLNAGTNATSASSSNFMGLNAGTNAANASKAVFIGENAGYGATDSSQGVFIGRDAGKNAANAGGSVFIGSRAGGGTASNAGGSVFVGSAAGVNATNAATSVFIGNQAGFAAINSAYSIFIGHEAGNGDVVDNTNSINDFSILIGGSTSTGGFSNSIALGSYATNTASNQFMIGSTTRPIDSTRINGSAATQCTITTGTGISCTSDERLKTNIEDIDDTTLAKLRDVRTVHFNWLGNPTGQTQVGFLAQNLEDSFPELVATDTDGYKSVYYAQMTPILVKAIQELDVKVDALAGIDDGATFMDSIAAWLANAGNRITRIFTGEICLTDESGDSECLNKEELGKLKQLLDEVEGASGTPAESPVEETVIETEGGITI